MSRSTLIVMGLIFSAAVLWVAFQSTDGSWTGVDESVIEHHAQQAGRVPIDPLINTDQGDLLLFLFLLAGAVAGFALGYTYRALRTTTEKPLE